MQCSCVIDVRIKISVYTEYDNNHATDVNVDIEEILLWTSVL